jgi:Kef-type K+ transport system membrane component KefB
VLARILYDRDLQHTPLGVTALASAAIDDVAAWTLLAVVVTVVGADTHQWRVLLFIPFVLFMVLLVRRALRVLDRRREKAGKLTSELMSIVLVGLLLSGAATEWMGLHFIFGAFLFGAVMPRPEGGVLRGELQERIGQMNSVLLLPVFFIVAGLKVDLSRITAADLENLGLIMVAAIGGKFGGAYLAARLNKLSNNMAISLASLMNTRGLTELIILGVGLQLHVLNTNLYSLMVVMAVVTTAMAGPMLKLFYRPTATEEADLSGSGQARGAAAFRR